MSDHEQTSHDGERPSKEVIQNTRNILAGDIIQVAGKVDFYRYICEEESPSAESTALYQEQQKLWEGVVKTTQEKLDGIDASNPDLHKMEAAPRR